MIVVVIIGIAAAMVVPMMSSAASFQARSAANMVAADLEYAKSMAISRGRLYAVVFDVDAESYEIVEDRNGTAIPIPHPITKEASYVVNFGAGTRLDRVDIGDADFDGTTTVKFNYLGSPFNGNNADLNDGAITLAAGDFSKTITVEPVTGYISVSE